MTKPISSRTALRSGDELSAVIRHLGNRALRGNANKAHCNVKPFHDPPNGLWGMLLLWQATKGKSRTMISEELYLLHGVRIAPSAMTRYSRHDVGVGIKRLRLLAAYFGLKPHELRDPQIAGTISAEYAELRDQVNNRRRKITPQIFLQKNVS